MRRKSWLEFLGLRSATTPGSGVMVAAAGISIRKLEHRRMLDASLAGQVLPPEILADEQANFAAEQLESNATMQFDWSTFGSSGLAAGTAGGFNDPVLTVVGDQTAKEGERLRIVDLATIVDTDIETEFNYRVSWGDASATFGMATIDQPGSDDSPTLASFSVGHVYADNGIYTVDVTVIDSNGGQAQGTFQVTVENVQPTLTGIGGTLSVDEGSPFTLSDLGVGVSDPGFDNPRNIFDPTNGQETQETLTGYTIDWGDGTAPIPVSIVQTPGELEVPTTGVFQHDPHVYADDGTYTVTIEFSDDDGERVKQSFEIEVQNVEPALEIFVDNARIKEGGTVTLTGTFSDPGFDNPNFPSEENLAYRIDWGDGTTTPFQPLTETSNGESEETTGVIPLIEHQYLDNDDDSTYTITVTVRDDDGARTSASIDITVENVAPQILEIFATEITAGGNTLLTIIFTDAVDEAVEFDPNEQTPSINGQSIPFRVLVDWEQNEEGTGPDYEVLKPLDVPTFERLENYSEEFEFVWQYTIAHNYDGPPLPLNPSADIEIHAVIQDDDALRSPAPATFGESLPAMTTVGSPGTEDAKFAIDLTPEIPIIEFPAIAETIVPEDSTATGIVRVDTTQGESSGGEAVAVNERKIVVYELNQEGEITDTLVFDENDEKVVDLQTLYNELAEERDYRYQRIQVVLLQTGNNSERIIADVVINWDGDEGKVIDPTDRSDDLIDSPPRGVQNGQDPDIRADDANPAEEPLGPELQFPPQSTNERQTPQMLVAGASLAAASAVIDPKTDWAVRLDRAFASADPKRWQRLRRRRPK